MNDFTDMAIRMLNDQYDAFSNEDKYLEASEWLDGLFYCSKSSIGYGLIKDWFIASIEDFGHAETMSKWFQQALQESIDVEAIEKEIMTIERDIELNLQYQEEERKEKEEIEIEA